MTKTKAKAKDELVDIEVTATFTVRFKKRLTVEQVAQLQSGTDIDNFVDESEPYRLAASEGDCEMEWDFASLRKNKQNHK